jgi:hypothetical protein
MPTVSIQYEVRQDAPAEGVYAVQVEVITADFIDLEIFTFDVEYSAFIGVSTVYGLRNYPRTRTAAVDAGLSFYRALGVTRTFDTVVAAENFVAVTKSRIETLRKEWQAYLDDFVAAETITTPE